MAQLLIEKFTYTEVHNHPKVDSKYDPVEQGSSDCTTIYVYELDDESTVVNQLFNLVVREHYSRFLKLTKSRYHCGFDILESEKVNITYSHFFVIEKDRKRELFPIENPEMIELANTFLQFSDGQTVEEEKDIVVLEELCNEYSFRGRYNPETKFKY